ncbi:MAG TPA: energy transducer TonB [Burkholderiales bacterium]|nr:energy transducer TonB [Burkholderiales bacterium]
MTAAVTPEALERRRDPALIRSFILAALVHLALVAIIFIGVRWQMSPPAAVEVELWDPPPPPPPAVQKVEPKPEPKIEPKPEPKPEPPKVEKPDIVEKAPPPKPKPEPKVEKKEVEKKIEKPAPPKPKADDFKKRLQEQLALEQKAIDAQRKDREAKEALARQQAAARQSALAQYIGQIQRKVKSNWILPQDLQGNPEAVFSVVQLPTGEILSVKLVKSSGIAAYDTAVERAILKSSPLPLPASRDDFSRELKLTFRPRD